MKNLYSKVLGITLIVLLFLSIIAPVHLVYAKNSQGSWITENNILFNTQNPVIEWQFNGDQQAYKIVYSLNSTFSEVETTEWITSVSPTHKFEGIMDNTYFVKGFVQDTYGKETEITDTLSFTVDTISPNGAFVINEDGQYTSTTEVNLDIRANDSNGVTYMSIKNQEDSQWGEWIPYKETYFWQLSDSEGLKIVNVRFMDIAGNISQTYLDHIILGDFSGSIDIEDGKSYVDKEMVNLTLEGSNVSEMRFSYDGIAWTEWEAFSESKTITLSPGNGRKIIFAQFRDYNGNVIEDKDIVIKGMGIPPIIRDVDDTTITDIKYHWAKNEIEQLVGMGIINGYPNKTFDPNGNILRGEFIKLITTSIGLEPLEIEESTFPSLDNHWSKPYVEAALMTEIIFKADYPEGFDPDGSITREEIAKIVVRAVGRGDEAEANRDISLDFTDDNDIKAKGYVKLAKEWGMITGFPDGSFNPTAEASRGQASVIVIRMINARCGNFTVAHEDTITISFAGDCTLGQDDDQGTWNTFASRVKKHGYEFFFEKVKPVFANDDFTIINLENTFTTATDFETEKKWAFKGDPDFVNVLVLGDVEGVHIANNHMHDYKQQGFEDTIKTLEEAGIVYYGNDTMSPVWNVTGGHLGYDYPRIITIRGVKVGLLGYKGWYGYGSNKDKIKNDIAAMKKDADIVIVTYHWGGQYEYYPNSMQKDLGRFAIDCGADLVVGHHPHVLQGIEKYKDKHIVYCLGNFSFGGHRNPEDRDCIIYQGIFTIKDGELAGIDGNIIPCKISTEESVNNFQPYILEGEEKERVMDRIYEYSSELEYGIKK